MNSLVLVTTSLLALSTSIASAQPASEDRPRRSPAKAAAIAALGTTVSVGVIATGIAAPTTFQANDQRASYLGWTYGVGGIGALGLTLTPALGHVYGEGRWLTTGMMVRLVGLGAVVTGIVVGESSHDLSGGYAGLGLAVAGGGALLTGAIMDIASAPSATKRWNAKHDGLSLSVAPLAIRTPSHATAPGVGIVGRF